MSSENPSLPPQPSELSDPSNAHRAGVPQVNTTAAVIALALAAFLSAMSMRVTDALLPRLSEQFTVSLAQASNVVTAFAIAYGLAQALFGPLGDKYGKYRVITWACLASALTTLACAFAPGYISLVVARMLAGAVTGAIIPLAMAWIGDQVPYEQRQPVLARFLLGQILGLSAGVWLGGIAADYLQWRTPFFLISLGCAAAGLNLLWHHRRQQASSAQQPTPSDAQSSPSMWAGFAQVLGSHWSRTVLLTAFLEGALVFGSLAFIATHLHLRHGISLALAGSMVMLFGFGGALYALSSGWLVRRLGEVGLVRMGGVIMAACLLLVSLSSQWSWAVPACFLFGTGFYMMHNTLQMAATQMAPERRGAAVALYASCFFMGQAAGVALFGRLMKHWDSGLIFGIGAGCLLLLAGVFAALRQRRYRAMATSSPAP